jgi:CRP-like cAMP-binding protein
MKSDFTVTEIVETLAASPFLEGMSERHLRTMAEYAMPSSFTGGEMVFREGDVANRFYMIQEGSVALESRSRESDPIHIQTIGAGDVLGWSWLFPPYLWHFDARAIEPVKVLFIYGSRLREHCEGDHDFGYALVVRMAEVMMRRLQATRWQLFEISDLALRSQWEALQLAAQLGNTMVSGPKHFRPARSSTRNKPQTTQKK